MVGERGNRSRNDKDQKAEEMQRPDSRDAGYEKPDLLLCAF
jgi:hypothetical protein